MKIDPVKKAPVPAISGEDLLATVPDISKYATVEVENLANVPSDYMDAELWVKLQKSVKTALSRSEVAGVVVSHGTDTLEETACFLDLTINPGLAGLRVWWLGRFAEVLDEFYAEQTADMVCRKTGRSVACRTRQAPLLPYRRFWREAYDGWPAAGSDPPGSIRRATSST